MTPSTQPKALRYKHQVFAKITDDQFVDLNKLARNQGKKVAELIRELIQDAIAPPESRPADSIQDDLRTCQELLQAMRTEMLTVGSCLMQRTTCDVRQVSSEAEGVAAVELAAFRERSTRRASLRNGLRAEAGQ